MHLNRTSPRKKILHQLQRSQTPTKMNTQLWTSVPAFCHEIFWTKVLQWPMTLLLLHQLPLALRMEPWSWWSVTSTPSLQKLGGLWAKMHCLIFLHMHASMEPPKTRCSKWVGWTNCHLKGRSNWWIWLKSQSTLSDMKFRFIWYNDTCICVTVSFISALRCNRISWLWVFIPCYN